MRIARRAQRLFWLKLSLETLSNNLFNPLFQPQESWFSGCSSAGGPRVLRARAGCARGLLQPVPASDTRCQ